MKRSMFLLIISIIGFIFGVPMLIAPAVVADGFGMASTPEACFFFRLFGGMLFSMGVLNFLIRNHEDSNSLRAVLIFNVAIHAFSMGNDILGTVEGVLMFSKVVPGYITHLFAGIGSVIYLTKMKSVSNV